MYKPYCITMKTEKDRHCFDVWNKAFERLVHATLLNHAMQITLYMYDRESMSLISQNFFFLLYLCIDLNTKTMLFNLWNIHVMTKWIKCAKCKMKYRFGTMKKVLSAIGLLFCLVTWICPIVGYASEQPSTKGKDDNTSYAFFSIFINSMHRELWNSLVRTVIL